MDTPPTFRFLFYPPAGYNYFSFGERAPFQPGAAGFIRANAAWAASLAMLSYAQDGASPLGWAGVQTRLTGAGFVRCMPIGNWAAHGTQAFLAERLDFAALAFRGTEPGDWSDVLLDLSLVPSAELWVSGVPGHGALRGVGAALSNAPLVHGGFQRAFNTVWPAVEAACAALPPGLPLVVCGHSLGGALALLAASRLSSGVNPLHLYTFGGPRTGSQALADRVLANTSHRGFRVVNDGDLVAAIPPPLLGYVHAPAHAFHLQQDGSVSVQAAEPAVSARDVAGALASIAALLAGRGSLDNPVPEPRLVAHSPGRYLARLAIGL